MKIRILKPGRGCPLSETLGVVRGSKMAEPPSRLEVRSEVAGGGANAAVGMFVARDFASSVVAAWR